MVKAKFRGIFAVGVMIASMIFATVFGFAGCGEKVPDPISVLGQKFSYQGIYSDQSNSRLNSKTAPSFGEIVKREFDKENLNLSEATINDVQIDLSSAKSGDELLKLMSSKAELEMNAKLSAWTVSISDEATGKITFTKDSKDLVYSFQKNAENNTNYIIKDSDGNQKGNFFATTNYSQGQQVLSMYYPNEIAEYIFRIKIPTKTTIDDEARLSDADGRTYVYIDYSPLFTLITE